MEVQVLISETAYKELQRKSKALDSLDGRKTTCTIRPYLGFMGGQFYALDLYNEDEPTHILRHQLEETQKENSALHNELFYLKNPTLVRSDNPKSGDANFGRDVLKVVIGICLGLVVGYLIYHQ